MRQIIERTGYTISFTSDPNPLGFGDPPSEGETALVVPGKPRGFGMWCYILNGNHVAEYEKCKTFKECVAYFMAHLDLESSWSDRPSDSKTVEF